MSTPARVALAIGGLLLAGVLVLLPLLRDDGPAGADGPDTLASARAAANLPPCPAARTADGRRLAGVRAACLGDGKELDVGRALAGRTTLVNVWATWCEPCREELPVLARYAASADAVDVLTVQVDSPPVDGLRMLAELGVRLPSVHDGDGRGPIRSALRTPGVLPASYLVDPDGRISFIQNPRLFSSVEQVRTAVARYGEGAAR